MYRVGSIFLWWICGSLLAILKFILKIVAGTSVIFNYGCNIRRAFIVECLKLYLVVGMFLITGPTPVFLANKSACYYPRRKQFIYCNVSRTKYYLPKKEIIFYFNLLSTLACVKVAIRWPNSLLEFKVIVTIG